MVSKRCPVACLCIGKPTLALMIARFKMNTIDLMIPISSTKVRHELDLRAGANYTRYMQGVVHIEKAEKLVERFTQRYEITECRGRRNRRRNKGLANVLMYAYPVDRTNTLEWFCLATSGDWSSTHNDQWIALRDRQRRLSFDRKYELKRLPLTAELAAEYAKKGRLPKSPMRTWTMSREYRQQWRQQIRQGVQAYDQFGSPRQLKRTVELLNTLPGHRGVRADVYELFGVLYRQLNARKLAKIESASSVPEWAKNKQQTTAIFTCRKVPLRVCAERYHAGAETWFPIPRPGQLRVEPLLFDRGGY